MSLLALADVFVARRRIRDFVRRTPLVRSDWLSAATGANVHLKLESLQITGSFKARGAFNAGLALIERTGAPRPPVVTASAGNHGRALAYAADQLGLPLTVFVPRNAPRSKIDAIRHHGAVLQSDAKDYDHAERAAKALAARTGATFISPYSHPDVIAGAGTVALEILEDLPGVDLLIVPVGGGGLISGVAVAARAISPHGEVAGVEVEASPVFCTSLRAGRLIEIEVGPSLADGLVGNADPETLTFAYIQQLVSRIALVGEDDLQTAIRGLAAFEHLIVEGAGAVGVAALASRRLEVRGRTVAVVVSGANIDLGSLSDVLGLS